MMKKYYLLFLFLFSIGYANAQAVKYPSGEIYNQLLQLQNTQTVLYIAAHPDDENTRLLSWLVNEKKCRAAYLSLTRGDGGQNLIGKEQGIPLGIVRTNELLEARKIDGAEQYFTRAYDFGFSKTSKETLNFWNEDSILSDMVWVIRNLQPDVVITRFPIDKRAGHGHHSASAILAKKAIVLAADESKFSWQLNFVKTWDCPQLFWNTFIRSGEPVPDTLFAQSIGDYVPTLGKSTSELAALARSMHKSQAFGTALQKDKQNEYFETWKGKKPTASILENTNNKWKTIENGIAIEKQIQEAISNFQFTNPANSTMALLQVYKSIQALPDEEGLKKQKLKALTKIIQACNGLYLELSSNKQNLCVSDTCTLTHYSVMRNANSKIIIDSIIAFKKNIFQNNNQDSLLPGKGTKKNVAFAIPEYVENRFPYWLQGGLEQQQFVNTYQYSTLTEAQHNENYEASVYYKIQGESFVSQIPINYKIIDDEKGEVQQPLQIIPAYSIEPSQTVYPIETKVYVFTVKNNKTGVLEKGDVLANGTKSVLLETERNDKIFSNTLETINLYHIPLHTWQKPALVKVLNEKILHTNCKVAYIAGTGDKIAEAIELIGYQVSILKEEEVYLFNLKKFKTVVIGIRAFSELKWLVNKHETLMEFVKQGGTLLVNYNSIGDGEKMNIGPYPFACSRKRITDEKATVTVLKPNVSVFVQPNKILASDWDGWVQERSVYHPEQYDSTKYIPLLSMKDESALLVCKYGKGVFVYNTLSLFRQLPAGHTGAHKLLANLIEIKLP
jgi:LmbE family N-acetylglucosaminyl deacetylase